MKLKFAALLAFCLFAGRDVIAESIAYVSVAGDQKIKVLKLNEESGVLNETSSVAIDGSPGALAMHPSGQFLFASVRGEGNLAAIHIGPDGGLSVISSSKVDADPSYVAVDPSGRYLISAYYRAGKVMVHSIGKDGSLSANAIQSIDTDEKAHAAVRDPSGKFLFVPHTGPNAIFQFRFDKASGLLTENTPNKLQRSENTGPRHLWFHPTLPFAFSSDEQGSSITSYDFDAATGQLKTRQTQSTLPKDYDQRNSTSDIEVHPNGKFVYVANRGHDSIAGFSINKEGMLHRIGNTSTEATPRSFNISPDGRYLIAAGQKSGRIATYKVHENGSLEKLSTHEIGAKPWWVLIQQK